MKRLGVALLPVVLLVAALVTGTGPTASATTVVREPLITMIKALRVASPSRASSYDRSKEFGTWTYHSTSYGHCNTRALVLIQESKIATTRNKYCTVLAGKWVSMYNG